MLWSEAKTFYMSHRGYLYPGTNPVIALLCCPLNCRDCRERERREREIERDRERERERVREMERDRVA